ncbi:MAG TPA: thiamine pyrophosphokinase [Cyclobacteriaceae bacterium]|nr:thiamine pyrophosphokinase [Cyclobacteriaceae bacterium]
MSQYPAYIMSSHHIIREDQEPALLIMDAGAVSMEQVQELLEWSPTVMVSDKALDAVMKWGIKIDVVVASTDRVAEFTTLLHDQFPLKLLSYNTEEEALSTALYFLIAKKQNAVNVIATEPLESFESFSLLDLSIFNGDKRWSFIRNGSYEKWLPAGRTVSVYPSHDEPDLQTQRDGVVIIKRDSSFWVSEF